MRLIDADALELDMQDQWEQNEISNGTWIDFRETLKRQPTIDAVEVVHGHWIDCDGYRECSKCGWLHAHQELNYCPICGAKMDEVTE